MRPLRKTVTVWTPDNTEWEIEFEYSPGEPAQTSGPPERCYPEEPEELNIIDVSLNGTECSVWLSPEFFEAVEQQVLDQIHAMQEDL